VHAQDDSAVLHCQSLAPPTLPTTVSCLAEQILLHFEFSAIFHQVGPLQDAFGPNAPDQVAQVQSPRFPVPRSSSKPLFEATPRFLHHFSEDTLSLFVSSLFENSAAPTPQRAIEQVPVQVQVSKDILSEFISSLFASSCSLIAQESIGQVKFSADDVVPSSSPKLFPGLTPEGVSVERDVGVGRESVGGYASASDSCPPTLTFPPHLLLPTPCSRQGVFCEDAVEQFVEECCGGCLDPTLPHLSPHLSLPPRIFICDYHDTKIALSFYLALTSSPDCVSGLWSESESPPPGTTVVPDVDTVDVNQPSDLDPRVSVQSFSS